MGQTSLQGQQDFHLRAHTLLSSLVRPSCCFGSADEQSCCLGFYLSISGKNLACQSESWVLLALHAFSLIIRFLVVKFHRFPQNPYGMTPEWGVPKKQLTMLEELSIPPGFLFHAGGTRSSGETSWHGAALIWERQCSQCAATSPTLLMYPVWSLRCRGCLSLILLFQEPLSGVLSMHSF